MPSEFYCPLLEDECITVKHVIEPEKINVTRATVQSNIADINTVQRYEYNNIVEVTEETTGDYCYIKSDYSNRRVAAGVQEITYYYDYNITVDGYHFYNPNAVYNPNTGTTTFSFGDPKPRFTVNLSGTLLRVEKHTGTFGTFYIYWEREGSSFGCNFQRVYFEETIDGRTYSRYAFAEEGLNVTWHTPPLIPTFKKSFYAENNLLVASHEVPLGIGHIGNSLINQPEVSTTYKINKADHLPNAILKQLEVADFAYNFLIGFVDPLNPYLEIPRHCLNIYMSAYPRSIGEPFTLSTDEIEFVMQICTDDPGTFERPTLEVSCGCGESCPENTCPVECLDHVCCYNADGISIKEILLSNYDG